MLYSIKSSACSSASACLQALEASRRLRSIGRIYIFPKPAEAPYVACAVFRVNTWAAALVSAEAPSLTPRSTPALSFVQALKTLLQNSRLARYQALFLCRRTAGTESRCCLVSDKHSSEKKYFIPVLRRGTILIHNGIAHKSATLHGTFSVGPQHKERVIRACLTFPCNPTRNLSM